MGVWSGLKWLAKEGTGTGVQRRLVRLILGMPGKRPNEMASIPRQFIDSASALVSIFGPVWARREIGDRPIGVWFLVCCWVLAACSPLCSLVIK